MVRFALQISELYLCIRRTFRKSEWQTKKSERIGLSDEQSLIDLSSSGTFFSFLFMVYINPHYPKFILRYSVTFPPPDVTFYPFAIKHSCTKAPPSFRRSAISAVLMSLQFHAVRHIGRRQDDFCPAHLTDTSPSIRIKNIIHRHHITD